jgi:hypothetical protein
MTSLHNVVAHRILAAARAAKHIAVDTGSADLTDLAPTVTLLDTDLEVIATAQIRGSRTHFVGQTFGLVLCTDAAAVAVMLDAYHTTRPVADAPAPTSGIARDAYLSGDPAAAEALVVTVTDRTSAHTLIHRYSIDAEQGGPSLRWEQPIAVDDATHAAGNGLIVEGMRNSWQRRDRLSDEQREAYASHLRKVADRARSSIYIFQPDWMGAYRHFPWQHEVTYTT